MNAPQYVTDAQGKPVGVFLDLDTYQEMVEALEDAQDRDFALDYEAREAAGLLTPDELDAIPLTRPSLRSKSHGQRANRVPPQE